MNKMLDRAQKYLATTCVTLGMMIICSEAPAQQKKYEPLDLGGEPQTLTTSFRLPVGCYRGSGPLTIDPGEDLRCTLEITETTVVESAQFILKKGAQLRVRGALLRECHISVQPGAEVVIESSGLERCEYAAEISKSKEMPSFRITNCILQGGAWMSPANRLGLELMDSVVREQKSNLHSLRLALGSGETPATLARRPCVRYTRFDDCIIHPTLLLMVSQVTVENSKGLFAPGINLFAVGANATPEIMMPVRWVNNEPSVPPTIGGGVGLQQVTEPIAGGCSLTATVEGGILKMEGMANTSSELFKMVLPTESSDGSTVSSSSMTPKTLPGGASAELKLKQSHVNGLLIMTLATGLDAGEVTKMNATAVPGNSSLRFSQMVGNDMSTALREVQKYMRLRHENFPQGVDLEISFEEKYSGKDGPSAAVACALLAESVMTGKTWDPAFAVTGDMNADGSVQPIGGVAAKVRGATKGACKIVAVPIKNERAISDILANEGPAPLAAIHVFALEHFDQAVSLASAERQGDLQQAITEFEVIRSVLQRDPRQMAAILRTPQAVTRLQGILQKAPHSLSAKYLLLFAQGRGTPTLSLGGSLEAADTNGMGLVNSIQNDFKGTVSTLKLDELGGTLNRLRNLRPRLDPRVWPYVDALVDYGEIVRSQVLNPAKTAAKFNEMASRAIQAASIIASAKKNLLADPQVREDLGL